ncbi:MAG: FAD-dependent oxidoreductase, partial [Clostridia bacterium]|nr:FAD-dependent oxidoreductase [Clostridia bacterium]
MTDIIIIGGGIAGLTSAVYALRSGKSVLLFEKKAYGGQISQSHAVENYPGFKNISGAELSMNLHAQAKDFGCEFKNEIVTKVIDGEIKKVITNKGEYEGKAVIFAMGAEPRKSGLENEQSLIGRGLSYCAVCDGNFFRNRETMVVGGGSTAVQDALYLAEICKKVYLVHRRDAFRAEDSLVNKLREKDNVELVLDSVLVSATASPILKSVTVKNVRTDEKREIAVNGLFLAIGQVPATKDFADILPLDEYGYVKAGEDCKVKEGIYIAGDCRKKPVRQLTTAAADGTVAATLACED